MARISFAQGNGSQLHNRRGYDKIGKQLPDNIDPARIKYNITLVDRDIDEVYHELFDDALDRYNLKQKRNDRKIGNYLDKIKKSKNGERPFYEDIIQYGSKSDYEKNPDLIHKAKSALMEYAEHFKENNPNLRLIGAYIHMDEASPHLHLDYVPVAHGYQSGMDTRNSLDKAMKEMGYAPNQEKECRTNNATKLWKNRQREIFKEICTKHGLEVEQERYDWGRDRFTSVREYKQLMSQIEEEATQKKEKATNELQKVKSAVRDVKKDLDKTEKQLKWNKKALDKAETKDSMARYQQEQAEMNLSNSQYILDRIKKIHDMEISTIAEIIKEYAEPVIREFKEKVTNILIGAKIDTVTTAYDIFKKAIEINNGDENFKKYWEDKGNVSGRYIALGNRAIQELNRRHYEPSVDDNLLRDFEEELDDLRDDFEL